jgi:hypothetical protein
MKKTRMAIITALVLIFSSQLFSEPEWQFYKEDEGIKSYTRKPADFPVEEAYGEGYVNASLEVVAESMTDLEKYFKYFKMVKKAYIAEVLPDGSKVVYTHIGMPWPVWDRDTVALYRVVREKDKITIITTAYNPYPKIPPKEKIIRMTEMKDVYTLTRSGERTLLKIISRANPAGDIPKTIINNLVGSGPINTIKAIRNMLKDYKKIK